MKKLFPILLTFLILSSCQKAFKEDEQNKFDTEYSFAVNALYNRLFFSIMGTNLLYLSSIANEDDMNIESRSFSKEDWDDYCPYLSGSDVIFAINSCFGGGGCIGCEGIDFTAVYKSHYKVVGVANDILSKAGDINKQSKDMKLVLGEVYYIRAYCYFRLVRLCGQVPIIDNTDISFTIKKPSLTQLYDFIVKDLNMAMAVLPKSNFQARIPFETPNRGTAKALLAEVYLTMGGMPHNDASKYKDAAQAAKDVIDSASFFGFSILPDLADLWNGKNQYNSETLLAIHMQDPSSDLNNGLDFLIYETFESEANLKNSNRYYWQIIAAPYFFNKFPKSYRKDVSFHTRHIPCNISIDWDTVTHTHGPPHFDSVYIKHYDTITRNTNIQYRKFYTQFDIPDEILLEVSYNKLSLYGHYTGQVIYIYRYAQTLLTYAEASARSSALDQTAYDAVNQVRRRANKVDLNASSSFDLQQGLSQQQFIDSVIQERAWELCGEPEGRWFDMLRLDLAKNLEEIKKKQNLIVWPIPVDKKTFYLPMPPEDELSE